MLCNPRGGFGCFVSVAAARLYFFLCVLLGLLGLFGGAPAPQPGPPAPRAVRRGRRRRQPSAGGCCPARPAASRLCPRALLPPSPAPAAGPLQRPRSIQARARAWRRPPTDPPVRRTPAQQNELSTLNKRSTAEHVRAQRKSISRLCHRSANAALHALDWLLRWWYVYLISRWGRVSGVSCAPFTLLAQEDP
eukprot:9732-Prorocentrum_minimum.AAC.3